MSRGTFVVELREAISDLDERALTDQLAALLPAGETLGLLPRMRVGLGKLADALE